MRKISIPKALDTIKKLMYKQYTSMSKETLIDILLKIAADDLKKISFKELDELLMVMSAGQLGVQKVRPDIDTIRKEDLEKALKDFDDEEE